MMLKLTKCSAITKPIFFVSSGNFSNFKFLFALILLVNVFSCSKNPETHIAHLEGYWEIESVILPDGNKKDYKYSNTVDYITFNDSLKGFRKKLKPNLKGTYLASNVIENITLKIENDRLNIYYKTPYASWKETVLEATTEKLKLINKDRMVYLYKRYVPINLNLE
ncbi:MAG: lipocalin family protein [Winogradskyella sp.]